jgi:hypothetical protein
MKTSIKWVLFLGGVALIAFIGQSGKNTAQSQSSTPATYHSDEPATYPKAWAHMKKIQGNLVKDGCGRENMYQCPLFGDKFGWVILDKKYDGQRAICALSGSNTAMEKALREIQDGSFMNSRGPALDANGLPAFYEHCFDVDTGEQSVRGINNLTFPKMNATAPHKDCKDEDEPLKTLACFGVETQHLKRS